MVTKTILLVALLVSATSAGPARQRNSKCSNECDETQKFFYELGKEYEYKYEAETKVGMSDSFLNEANVRVSALAVIQPVTNCEMSLLLKDVILHGSENSDAFAAEVTRRPLRFEMQNGRVEHVCGSDDELSWVVNFKKSILSSIQNSMTDLEENEVLTETDVSGICETSYSSEFKDSELVVTKTKLPFKCEHKPKIHQTLSSFGYSFDSLVQGLPIVKSSQTCTQHISDEIISKVYCEEDQWYVPFEGRSKGAQAHSKTSFELSSVRPKSSAYYYDYFNTKKSLLYDYSEEDKGTSSLEKAEDILARLDLLSQNGIKREVPALFSELVALLRDLSHMQIQSIYNRSEKQLRTFLIDALPLAKTAESMSAFVDLILKGEISDRDKSIWFTSLSSVSNPTLEMFSAVEPLLESSERTKALLGISSMVHTYCERHEECERERIIEKILRNFESRLGSGCRSTTEEEKLEILYSLKAIGNVGRFINAEPSLIRCYSEENPMEVRVSAIEAWRRAPCSYDRLHLLSAYEDQYQDNEIRISSYLGLMKCPTKLFIDKVKDRLTSESVNQVASFVWTHLTNLQESAAFEKQSIRELIGDELLHKKFSSNSLKLSRNFESSFYLKEQQFGSSIDSNVIFSDKSFLPRSSMLNLTVELFGQSINLFELGGRIEGFEAYIEKFFGPNGYYPEETIEAIIKNLRKVNDKHDDESPFTQDSTEPKGSYYLKLFGNEIFYRHFERIEDLLPVKTFTNVFDIISELISKGNVDFTKSYSLINSEFTFPTITGFPLRLKLDGKATIDVKLDGTFNFESLNSINLEGKLRPSAAIMFDSSMTIDAFVSKSGMKMVSTAHSATAIEGKALVKGGKLIDLTINTPDEKTEIYEVSNEFFKIEDGVEIKETTPGEEYEYCQPLLHSNVGLEMCREVFISTIEDKESRLFLKPLKAKLYLKKTDSHSSYIIHYTHTPEETTLLFDMPDSQANKKWYFSLSHILKKYELYIQTPSEKYNTMLSYVYDENAIGYDFEFKVNDAKMFKSKFYIEREIEDTHRQVTLEAIVERGFELININGKSYYDLSTKSVNGKLNLGGKLLPKMNIILDLNRKQEEDTLNFEVVSTPLELSMSGKVGSLSLEEGLLRLKGKYSLYGSPVKALTMQMEYKNIENEDGSTFTCSTNIDEIQFNNYIKLHILGDNYDTKIKGKIFDKTWNIENSYKYEKTDSLYEVSIKQITDIPALKYNVKIFKHLLMSPKKFLLEKEFKVGELEAESSIHWNYGKNLQIHFKKDFIAPRYFDLEIENVIPGTYKFTASDNILRSGTETRLESTLETKLGQRSIDASVKGILTTNTDSDKRFSWTIKANDSRLLSDTSFDLEDTKRFFKADITKSSFFINTNIGKHFNAEGKIESKEGVNSFTITSNLEGKIFDASGTLQERAIEGVLKYDGRESKILARLNEKGAEFELQISPSQRFGFLFNYEFGEETILEVSLETPFKNWEKQNARLLFKRSTPYQGQLSITWQNTHHIGLSFELNVLSSRNVTGFLRFSSTLEGFEKFELNLKHLHDLFSTVTELDGKWNSEIIKVSLNGYLRKYESILNFVLKTPIFKDISVSFEGKNENEKSSASLDFSYGAQKSNLLLKLSFIDDENMTGSFTCQSPFLPEINLSYSFRFSGEGSTIEVKGNYNKHKLILHCNCEKYLENESKICKMTIKLVASSFKVINGSYSHIIKANKFESDIELASHFLSEKAIKGHIMGRITSPLSALLNGYISGPNFTSKINVNHEISDGKINTEGNIEFNDFKVSISVGGKVDLTKMEGFVNLMTESSCQTIDGVKVFIEHEAKDMKRETHITLSKNEKSIKIYHIFAFKDHLNWSNYLKINDIFNLKNEMELEDGVMKHVSSATWMNKTIRFKIQKSFGDKLNIVAVLNTPWISDLQLTLMHQREDMRNISVLKFEYGNGQKLIIDSEYEFRKTFNFIKVSLSNLEWNLNPIEFELTITREGANKVADITVRTNNDLSIIYHMTKKEKITNGSLSFSLDKIDPISFLLKYSVGVSDKEIYIEYERLEKYFIDVKVSGNMHSGTISALTHIPSIFEDSVKNTVTYNFSKDLKKIVLNTDVSEKTYQFDLSVYPGKFVLKSNCPHGEGSLIFNWQFDELEKSFSIDFISPFKNVKNGSFNFMLDKKLDYHISLGMSYDIQSITFDGKFNGKSIKAKVKSSFSDWKTLSLLIELDNKEIIGIFSRNSDMIKFNGKGSFDYKQGEADIVLQLPFVGYEDNSISIKYTKSKSDFKLYLNTNIGKKDFKLELQLSSLTGISLDIQSPWKNIEKIYIQAVIEKSSVKLNGRFNDDTFELVLKATKNEYKNFTFIFTMTSTIPGWTGCSFEINILLGKNPYKISLNIRHEEVEYDYSTMLDISKNNLRFKVSTPMEILKIVEIKGNYAYQNKKLETSLTLTLNEKNFKFSGYIDDNSVIPNINVDILTPYEELKDIKFMLGGSLKDEKSVNFFLKLGEHISKLSSHASLTETSGSASVSLIFPTFNIENIDIQLSYDLESENKYILLDTIRGDIIEKYYIGGKITSNELNIEIESPFENYKRFLITGKYERENDGTLVFGKIIKGEEIYRFEGKLMVDENGYKLKSSIPLSGHDVLFVNGEVSKEKIILSFNNGHMERKISISYMLKSNSAFVKISTPFENISYFALGGEYDINNDSVNGKIFIYRNEDRIDMSGFAHISPKKSNIKLNISLSEDTFYLLDIFYDILSKKKEARFEFLSKSLNLNYSVEGLLGNLNHGFLKLYSSYPGYELNGFEYKLRTKTLTDTEAFITLIQNSKEYSAGIISKFDENELKLKFLTPLKNYEEFGIESKLVPEAKEGKIKIMLGSYKFNMEGSLKIDDFYICIETPFKFVEILRIISNYEFSSPSKYMNIEFEYNDIKYQINGKIDASLSSPSVLIKLSNPSRQLKEFELRGKFNLDSSKVELKYKFNDVYYSNTFDFEFKNYKGLVSADITTPFEGWKTLKFHIEIDLEKEEKVFKVNIEKEGITNRIYFSGKVLEGDVDFDVQTPFETIGNFKTKGSVNRSKRSVEFMMMNDANSADIVASFNSLKIKATTPFEKASDVEFEISKNNKGGWFVNYHRNGNKVYFNFSAEPKKKGISITIESEVPGWEFLALSGRLDPEEILAYIDGRIDSGTLHLTGSGVFGDKSGSLTITSHSSFDEYKEVITKVEYNVKRNIFTFDSRSSSSDYKILFEFKRGLTIDVFVPNEEENTVASGKLTIFKGNLNISSRFPSIRTFSLKYETLLSAKITSETTLELNGVKLFEMEFERDAKENKAHFQVHLRRGENHSMLHFHREGFKTLHFTFNRNDKEFKVNVDGSGDLPTSGSLVFTISNSFRESPRTITGKLDVDRTSSPKKLHLEFTNHLGKLYIVDLTYNASLRKIRKGDFILRTTTPERSSAPWKDISGNWDFDENDVGKVVLKVGPVEYSATGKIGIDESDLIFSKNIKDKKYFVQWKIKESRNSMDYFLKYGPEDNYFMGKLQGRYDDADKKTLDFTGAFRLSKIMEDDFTFTSTYTLGDDGLTGSGTFQMGKYSGTHTLTKYIRDPIERSATFHWEAQSNIPKFNSVVLDGSYNLSKRYADIKLSWDTDELSIKFSLDNLTLLKSENTIRFHGPLYGDSEITLSHDFSQSLEGHVKALGNLGPKKVSILANWSTNKEFTKLNFHVDRDFIGKATLHAEFDVEDPNNAKGTIRYKVNDKYIDVDISRVKTKSNLFEEIVYKSNIEPFTSARSYINVDWSKDFKIDSSIEWGEKSIKTLLDIGPKSATASITTPFPKFGDININAEYDFKKAKSKTLVLRYERGDKVGEMNFNLKFPTKKSGSLDFSLSTPFEVLKTLTLNANWKKGNFNAVYKRNDVTVNIEGKAEITSNVSSFALKFALPSGKVFEIEFSFNLEDFIKGKGETPSDLINVKFNVEDDKFVFNVKGLRTSERLYIEIDQNTTLGFIENFHLKIDSELNLSNREGFFEVTADEFHFSVKNRFEKKPKGFYLRSQFHSTLTSLPGLTLGLGKDGDSFIFTTGYGDEREITFTLKGKDHFRKGFYGKIDIPRREIYGLEYNVAYSFKSDDKLQVSVKVQVDEGKFVDVEILYNSDGVKARLLSPWTGLHRARARRSISNDYFLADIGVDNYGITIESDTKSSSFKKGFKIEGEIFGERYMIYAFANLDTASNSEGKFILETPFRSFKGSFTSKLINQRYYGDIDIDLFYLLFAKIDVELPNKIKGEATLKLESSEYKVQLDFHRNSEGPVEGKIIINTPFDSFERIVVDGSIKALSVNYFQGSFTTEFLRKTYSLYIDFKQESSVYNLNTTIKLGSDKEYRIESENIIMKNPFVLRGKSSVHLNNHKLYSSSHEITYNAYNDVKIFSEILCGKDHFNGSFMLDVNVNEIIGELRGKIMGLDAVGLKIRVTKLFKEVFVQSYLQRKELHTLDFMFSQDIDTKKISLNIDSPNVFKFSFEKVSSNASVNLLFKTLIKENKFILNIDSQRKLYVFGNKKLVADANIIIPYFSFELDVHAQMLKEILEAAASLKIYDNLHKVTIKQDDTGNLSGISIAAHSSLIPGKEANIKYTAIEQSDISRKYTFETKILDSLHSVSVELQREEGYGFLLIFLSPYIPTGMIKLGGNMNVDSNDLSLNIHFTDAQRTLSSQVNTKINFGKETKMDLTLRTPFENYKKIEFGLKYINDDIKHVAVYVKPFNIAGEVYFGIKSEEYNVGLNIKTEIKNYEVTKSEIIIPLNKFDPKISAHIGGVDYELKARLIEKAYGKELYYSSKNLFDLSSFGVSYRTKAPYDFAYEYEYKNCLNKFGIMFDSSILRLAVPMLI